MASGPDVAADGSREGTSSSTSSSIAPPEPGIRVLFKVDIHVAMEPNEGVYVSGSSPVLGEWQPAKAHPLEPHPEIPGRWIGLIIADADAISFRYFIGYKLFGEVEHLIVSQCEAHLNPRHVLIRAENRGGECRKNHVDIFEFYAGRRCVSEGWLQYDEENQILLSVHGRALKFFKADRTNCRIRVHPLDVRRRQPGFPLLPNVLACPGSVAEDEEDDEEPTASTLPSHSSTHVSALSSASSANSKYQPQPEKGVTFNNLRDYLVFKTRSVAVEFLAFFIEIYSEDERRIGSCFALPSSLQETSGATSLPFINSSGRPIGQITVEYLFIRNLRKAHPPQLMDISYAKHWKKRSTIEVGHRGAGNSYTKFAAARENTIHSLNTAAANGADYVEFDVQLTKDKIAVIYHDFHVLLSVAKKMWDREGIELSDHYHEMALKDLKLKQLKLLKMEHMSHPEARPNVIKLVSDVEEEDDFSPFPTLLEALHKVDPDVGFNIEVKYPMMQEDGLHECANYFERNEFVDIILADVLAHAGCRRVMFSSFDPDICAMLSMKQHRYPVFFLCVGETKRYAKFKDQRCSNSLASVNFASGADILGINFNSEDLLNDPRPVRRAAELGLVSFVWGDDLDTKENIYYFKRELGVDGLIYDRIGEEERRRNVFVVEREAKRALNIITSGDSTPVRVSSPERDRSTNDQQAPTSPSKSRWATIREDDKEDLSASLEPESPPSNQSTVSSTGAVESLRDLSLVDNATNDGSYLPPSMVPMTSIS